VSSHTAQTRNNVCHFIQSRSQLVENHYNDTHYQTLTGMGFGDVSYWALVSSLTCPIPGTTDKNMRGLTRRGPLKNYQPKRKTSLPADSHNPPPTDHSNGDRGYRPSCRGILLYFYFVFLS